VDFEELVRKYGRMVYSVAYEVLGSEAEAREAAQEAFLKAWLKRDTFRGEAKVSTWLYTIAKRTALDHLRRLKRRREVPLEEAGDPPAPSDAKRLILEEAIRRLPEREREAIRLFYQAGLSGREAAEVMGVSEGNFRVILYRARRRLRELLRGREDELL